MYISSSDDENRVICPCPVCGEELANLDEFWRQIHINGCLSKEQPSMLQRCQVDKCPICGKKLGNLSAELANMHINECMDKKTSIQSTKKKTERCPFCGQCLKGMNDRQRKIHDQTCRKSDKIKEVDVVRYPKIVEDLPTPAEWETEREFRPIFIEPQSQTPKQSDTPLYGKTFHTWEIQRIQGFQFSNDPFYLEVPPEADVSNAILCF